MEHPFLENVPQKIDGTAVGNAGPSVSLLGILDSHYLLRALKNPITSGFILLGYFFPKLFWSRTLTWEFPRNTCELGLVNHTLRKAAMNNVLFEGTL